MSRLSQGELIAGVSGLALFVVLFLPWYGVDVNVAGFSASESASAWEAFDMTDIVLFLVSAVAVGAAAARLADAMPEGVPVAAIVDRGGGARAAAGPVPAHRRFPDRTSRTWPAPASTSVVGSGSSWG